MLCTSAQSLPIPASTDNFDFFCQIQTLNFTWYWAVFGTDGKTILSHEIFIFFFFFSFFFFIDPSFFLSFPFPFLMSVSRVLACLCVLLCVAAAYRAPLGRLHPELKYEPEEYMVQLHDAASLPGHLAQVRQLLAHDHSEIFNTFNINDQFVAYSARLSPEVLEKVLALEAVKLVEPNSYLELYASQDNPINWGLDRIDQRNLPLNKKYLYSDVAGEGVDAYIIGKRKIDFLNFFQFIHFFSFLLTFAGRYRHQH